MNNGPRKTQKTRKVQKSFVLLAFFAFFADKYLSLSAFICGLKFLLSGKNSE